MCLVKYGGRYGTLEYNLRSKSNTTAKSSSILHFVDNFMIDLNIFMIFSDKIYKNLSRADDLTD